MKLFYIALLVVGFLPARSWACSACGCTLSPDWQTSANTDFTFDLRYDYINQTQLRSGVSTISGAEASQRMTEGGPQEVEKYTENQYLTLTGEYQINSSWKVDMVVPYIVRRHSTLGTNSDGTTAGPDGDQYTSNTKSLGDIKLLGRFQGFTEEHDWGLIFGFKLPTGSHALTGDSDDETAGPVTIDRGLQPGTGTTDAIVGVSYTKSLDKNWDSFAEFLYQTALNSADRYRPGDGYNLNLGARYFGFESVLPQLQINTRYANEDTGEDSDPNRSTGGTLVYLSPGLTVPLPSNVDIYAFVQLPVYQYVIGVQLTPTSTASLGVRYGF